MGNPLKHPPANKKNFLYTIQRAKFSITTNNYKKHAELKSFQENTIFPLFSLSLMQKFNNLVFGLKIEKQTSF